MTETTFSATDEQRRTVRAMAGFGVSEHDIAVLVDVDLLVLREHFRDDMERGAAEGLAKVAQSLFMLATREKNVAAAIFWMKARAGWSGKAGLEITGKDGAALDTTPLVVKFVSADDGKPRGFELKAPVLVD